MHYVVYDGTCNLCVNFVKILEDLDRGQRFRYVPMQETDTLAMLQVEPQACEMGMILIDGDRPERRWQGSDAAEEIGRLLPAGQGVVDAYRALPGLKWLGDRLYAQVRDHRYALFGQRASLYQSAHPVCTYGNCPPGQPSVGKAKANPDLA
ncbi:MAG: DCC1-like thiol-disulfide oxidoreductase family protein [Synechococcales bacterium]|nr:DCC1-like thiol-disulfide oxidoreductase family protein [Synechococcales bacterium]